ncbi:Iron-regulated protein A precursor [Marinomonas gallaica]|uniref:Iron-regulated protein A n=1 Tax=Marinomonas gallaica TaxID=1806667 RepID=A0A1C3JTX9_9GAMM|nr:imelysin family protein [Marinomonas gallaica]SBT18490.1 Iron-regulated protein A precursor [Marinomonas gallaica]SBT22801.1 Iron-regulated protein A precursor [Marinomonas gallaica]
MLFIKKAFAASLTMLAGTSVFADQWDTTLEQIQSQYIVPKYQQFSTSANQLADATHALCAAPSKASLSAAQMAFNQNINDWQQVQWLNFGPVTYFMRYYAYEYWPDKKGVTQRQLRNLSSDPSMMAAPKFWTSASIAVRGMTAIESLLYHGDFDAINRKSDCEVLEAISRHHAKTTEDVLSQWQQSKATDWIFPEEGASVTPEHLVLEQLVQQWLEHMSVVKDAKLETPIGYKDRPNLKLAEFYRSEASLAAIITNLKAYRTLYHVGQPSLYDTAIAEQPELAKALEAALADSLKLALQLPQDYFTGDYSQDERVALAKPLVRAISNSQTQLTNLVTALGFQIGFNSRDGD